jgi:hypothetical protein
MIELSSTGGGIQDTRSVLLENGLVSFDGDSNWSLGNSSLQLVHTSWGDSMISFDINISGSFGIFASSSNSFVWILRLKLLSMFLSILEGVGLPSTTASVGRRIAVNKLLLSEWEKFSSFDEMSTLNSSSGRESPA